MKIDTIVIEGVDKTGKDTLLKYIDMIGNHRYAIYTRGNISNIVYAKAFNRNVNNYKMHPHIFYVLLTGEKDDLDIRFKITNEPYTDIERDTKLFNEVFVEISTYVNTATYNTSYMTPYQIAKDIVEKVNKINEIN